MQFAAALTAAVADIPAQQRQTLRWYEGVQMARHDLVAHVPRGSLLRPRRPSLAAQRGTNENTNGLLRQHLPRPAAPI